MQKKIAIIFHNVTVYFVVSIKKLNSLDEHKNSIKNLTDPNFLNSNVFKKKYICTKYIYIYMYMYIYVAQATLLGTPVQFLGNINC